MIVVKDVGRQIKSNRLVAERDHVRMNDGLDGSSQPKYSVNLAYSQVTRIVWALKIDRAARGGNRSEAPASTLINWAAAVEEIPSKQAKIKTIGRAHELERLGTAVSVVASGRGARHALLQLKV